ncbi:glycoside hydrolase [Martelella endophytica]|uniref:Glycoside hydrolase n=2 Tax=Martelella endophytica TaxID=1486262 RepID=A0A0D5LVP3_MAREN|nr:glycoside hydrolase [Martelella endophytica]
MEDAALSPNPYMTRANWTSLDGEWEFAHDDAGAGLANGWDKGDTAFDQRITVPYPPESVASGVNAKGFHPVIWYRRVFEVPALKEGERLVIHFGAVDYYASVWVNGRLVAKHEGGHTPFSADITDVLGTGAQTVVVRAEDPCSDVRIPRGKQDWQEKPHDIWYDRTSGIWQPVWLTVVPKLHITDLAFVTDIANARVRCEVRLSAMPERPVPLTVKLGGDEVLAEVTVMVDDSEAEFDIAVPALRHGMTRGRLMWSPDKPTLIDAELTLAGAVPDRLSSYLGLRTVGIGHGHFLLNDRPKFLRLVLGQNYWPDTHLATKPGELREEVEHIKALGFNGVRVHQKVEDPRFLYWCDRLGVMVWEEMPSGYAFSASLVERASREWAEVIRRDKGHPCIIAWVPLNESWGVQDISERADQLHFADALYHLTKALDPSRPAISNDGWELGDTDILSLHDYAPDGEELGARYGDGEGLAELIKGYGAAGRRILLKGEKADGRPLMLTEFGGVSFTPETGVEWHGYATVSDGAALEAKLEGMFEAIAASQHLMGYCYTQLTDTLQETNGLLLADRTPKIAVDKLRRMITLPSAAHPQERVAAEREYAKARSKGIEAARGEARED